MYSLFATSFSLASSLDITTIGEQGPWRAGKSVKGEDGWDNERRLKGKESLVSSEGT